MATLSLSFLGPFEGTLAGEPVPGFRTAKVQALLVYLATETQTAHRREALMALLWPGLPEDSARVNLRRIIYLLRQMVPELPAKDAAGGPAAPFLIGDRQLVRLNPEADYEVDVRRFGALIDNTLAHEHLDMVTCQDCRRRLAEAVALYRGDFLADFYLEDSNAFEEWAAGKRESLRREMLEALDSLTSIYLKLGEHRDAQSYARQQLEIDELHEKAHRQLMQALALDGQRNEALVQYEIFRQLLKEELGVEPEEETTTLCEQIRSGSLEIPEPATAGPGVPPRLPEFLTEAKVDEPEPQATIVARESAAKHNLPAETTAFVGREEELQALANLIADPTIRLTSIVAPGGMGKTRLALEVARRQLGNFEHGVYFVPLAPLHAAEALVSTIAQALGFNFYKGGGAEARATWLFAPETDSASDG